MIDYTNDFPSFWTNLHASFITYIHRNVLFLLFGQGHDVHKAANSTAYAKWKEEVGGGEDS